MKSWVWIVATFAMGAAPALGQLEGKTALVHMGVGNITRNAAIALEMEVRWRTNEAGFLEDLRNGSWDLVALDLPGREVSDKATMLSLFEEHLARGGRLMVNYPELDQWPELQALLEVRTTRDRDRPAWLYPPAPIGNPIWGGTTIISNGPDLWPDNGDSLEPTGDGYILARFESRTGEPAAVIRRDKLTVVNGCDWDSYESAGLFLAEREILYLLGCRPDIEPDGHLDIFDFLEFQDRWATGIRTANWDFDESFSIFDFIEFQNDFAAGCP